MDGLYAPAPIAADMTTLEVDSDEPGDWPALLGDGSESEEVEEDEEP